MDAEILLEIDVLDGLPDKSGRCLDLIEMFRVGYFIPMPEQACLKSLGGVHRRETFSGVIISLTPIARITVSWIEEIARTISLPASQTLQ